MSSSNNRKYKSKTRDNKRSYKKKTFNKKSSSNRNFSSYMVRISNLPDDITDLELKNLIRFDYTDNNEKTYRCNWDIGKCFIMNNKYGFTGMIDFKIEAQAKYVVESLDKTPFANQILKVELLPPKEKY